MSAIVDVQGLEKRFGDVQAVAGVTFDIAEGEIFGLLGPNGAGKTTTISMMSCLLAPDAGEVRVAGSSVRGDSLGVRRALGVVPQEIALYPSLTAAENLRFWGRMYGLSGKALDQAVDYGLKMAGLEDKAKKRVETFSGGMKRRINIAAGILHRPKVLLMDEPTVGIDPQSRNHILDTVRELNAEGMTVLYTSHYMEEVEALCDRIGIVDHGKLIALGDLEQLRALVGDEDVMHIALGSAGEVASEQGAEAEDAEATSRAAGKRASRAAARSADRTEVADDEPAATPEAVTAAAAVRALGGITRVEALGSGLEVIAPDAAAVLGRVVETIGATGATVRSIEVVEPNLESVFLHLTGRGLRD